MCEAVCSLQQLEKRKVCKVLHRYIHIYMGKGERFWRDSVGSQSSIVSSRFPLAMNEIFKKEGENNTFRIQVLTSLSLSLCVSVPTVLYSLHTPLQQRLAFSLNKSITLWNTLWIEMYVHTISTHTNWLFPCVFLKAHACHIHATFMKYPSFQIKCIVLVTPSNTFSHMHLMIKIMIRLHTFLSFLSPVNFPLLGHTDL